MSADHPGLHTILQSADAESATQQLATELVDRDAIGAVAENARLGLVDLLARRGAEFECLNVDAGRLFARIAQVPNGLFR